MNTNASSLYTIYIPENGVGFLNHGGRYLQIVKALGSIKVKVDQTEEKELLAKQGIHFPDGFERATFRTPDGHAAQIRVWAGDDEFIDRTVEQVEAPTLFLPIGNEAKIAANGEINLTGEPSGELYRRKCIVVSNLDPAVPLYLMNQDNQTVGVVRAGETISHPVSGFVRIKNKATAAVSAVVSEIWWSL